MPTYAAKTDVSTSRSRDEIERTLIRSQLRARVTYAFGSWWYDLRAHPGHADYTHPTRFATAALAADAARRELAIRTDPDPIIRTLMRIGALPVPTATTYALAN